MMLLYDLYIIKLNIFLYFKFIVKIYIGFGVVLLNLYCRLVGSYIKLIIKKMNKCD